MWRRALLIWLLIVVVESIHGTIRELFIKPAIGDVPARQVSVFTGSLLILLVATLTAPWLRADRTSAQLQVGFAWVILIVAFEVGLGLALGYTVERILADYRPAQGGLMGFGLLVLLLSPMIGARLRRASKPNQ